MLLKTRFTCISGAYVAFFQDLDSCVSFVFDFVLQDQKVHLFQYKDEISWIDGWNCNKSSLFLQVMVNVVGNASEVGSSKGDNVQFNNVYFMDIVLLRLKSDRDLQYHDWFMNMILIIATILLRLFSAQPLKNECHDRPLFI